MSPAEFKQCKNAFIQMDLFNQKSIFSVSLVIKVRMSEVCSVFQKIVPNQYKLCKDSYLAKTDEQMNRFICL